MKRNQITAEDMLELIQNMEVEERWKLLNEMFYLYFNKHNLPRTELDLDY